MCREIKRLMQEKSIKEFNKVYSLGSWYGNMAFFMLRTHVPFEIMVDVDMNPKYLEVSKRLLPELVKEDRLVSICGDCNRLKYRCAPPSLVINNSTNNMPNDGWLERIPQGTIVAIQGRSNEPNNKYNDIRDLNEFNERYSLRDTMFVGTISLEDPGDKYDRWMKIGVR